jgi:hypothetical protein
MSANLKAPNYYEDLISALHDLVKFAPNGNSARRIAALMNQPYSTMMNSLSQVDSNAGCRMDAAALEGIIGAAGGEVFMARYFAGKAGGIYVDLPVCDLGAEDARKVAMRTMRELGEVCRSFEDALDERGPAGSDVTDGELREFEAQATRLMASTKLLSMACRRVLEDRMED